MGSTYNHYPVNMTLSLFVLQYRCVIFLSVGLFQYGCMFVLFFTMYVFGKLADCFKLQNLAIFIIGYDYIRSNYDMGFCCHNCMTCWRAPLLAHGNYDLVYFCVI
jgi:hypothetical protein